jgi:predicted nucleic acid-binding protein
MVARRDWTRRWFDSAIASDRIVSSVAVLDELRRGDFPGRNDAVSMLDNIEMLELEDPVYEIVEAYLAHKLMPVDPFGDALHLALASYHRCDFLVTWNCQHLANANKFGQIRRINGILGLFVPELVTPMELLGENAGP